MFWVLLLTIYSMLFPLLYSSVTVKTKNLVQVVSETTAPLVTIPDTFGINYRIFQNYFPHAQSQETYE
jgi:hypothetical protein